MTGPPIFIAASLILIVTPGPDILYVIASGVTQGRSAGLLSASGVTDGILVYTVFAALGLAVLLLSSGLVPITMPLTPTAIRHRVRTPGASKDPPSATIPKPPATQLTSPSRDIKLKAVYNLSGVRQSPVIQIERSAM